MEITKLSTKGQVVIPETIRRDLEVGTAFQVTRKRELIILKPLQGLTPEEEEEMKELEAIWKDIDEGRGVTMTVEEFLNEMKSW